ncbi:MAG: GNAT family N-acetyltransferase [Candidatus Limnocylindrales bacterium]
MDLEIIDVPEAGRYEARGEGQLVGILEYIVKRGRIALVHTEVLPELEGRGIAAALAKFALADARRQGLPVVPSCPYVRAYLERHPEERDVPASAPARAGRSARQGGGTEDEREEDRDHHDDHDDAQGPLTRHHR